MLCVATDGAVLSLPASVSARAAINGCIDALISNSVVTMGKRGKHTDEKECYCRTCDRWFNYLGIASHRAAHLRKGEECTITYTNGDTYKHGGALERQEQR